MFKTLPPENGLWHLDEQCGLDYYVADNINLEVNMQDYDWYEFGMLHGMSFEDACKFMEDHGATLKQEECKCNYYYMSDDSWEEYTDRYIKYKQKG